MEILNYTEDHLQFRNRLKKFLEKEVVPYIDQWEKAGIVPKAVWQKMGADGFLCTEVSPKYNGLGGDFLYSVIVAEELGRINFSGLMAYVHSDIFVPYITSYGSEEIKRKYLPGCVSGNIITALAMTEPDAGSDVAGIQTTAVTEGDQVVINGTKTFISNAVNCDIVIVAAKDPLEDRPYHAISLYIVEAGTPGFKKGNQLNKLGYHSQDTAELFFSNCRIPQTNRLGNQGQGFFMLMEELQRERLMVSIFAIAGAEHILDETIKYCKETSVSGKPISKQQSVRFKLVEMSAQVKVGRAFIDKLIADHMEGKHIVLETSMAKYWIADMAKQTADVCMDLYGQYGYLKKAPIERFWRDVRVMPIFAGTNEIMKTIIAKHLGI
ncbi:MAG: acyl-CoA dehydrogenase family protein [Deltaproteobacteria bacterium]|nr:acyl-CoA dehydrogenase family protein [Deltaproteobacteria bacterium]